ncbi:Arginase, catabolizes arginine to ornithine and urea [Orbilia oligospora]|uniref:Arginase n=1 Tax=Orbilia oligospora TaxID=2813651 RepID=A0A7C8PN26_ORBOL|nr:Arginase, catabolizes arginine to ornithine and urea [Orbilia oligospora]KAF3164313.1 Arginase, catabolizes arginine to ornithine and urea [Orbilia oligospora]KAF3181241.1 Arginase, catabolizes arginine to ornithine and urea [Orbilia oligospora]KAF3242916.1 Arginase, catabolizes arginine to ornithine and urea [Orbilia oligospora]KAF3260362.1 Arginase, catabolizes arginine to ornithine and urea [Orbilia oligospora]
MSSTPVSSKFLTSDNELGVVAVAFSGGQPKAGVDRGPKAMIESGLLNEVKSELGYTIHFDDTIHSYETEILSEDPTVDNMKRPQSCSNVNHKLHTQTYEHASQGRLVLTLGGDHSIAIGSISGVSKAIRERLNKPLAVIWVDAHADINTYKSSPSGNIHGMPVAFLTGLCSHDIFGWLKEEDRIPVDKLVYIGLRDVDSGEKKILRENKIKAFSMHDIDRYGIGRVVDMALEYIGDDTPIHLSFDVDACDPAHAPSTGTPVRGGLTLREGDFICEAVHQTGRLVAMDLVEVNPSILAQDGGPDTWQVAETVRTGCSLVRCALGESLL